MQSTFKGFLHKSKEAQKIKSYDAITHILFLKFNPYSQQHLFRRVRQFSPKKINIEQLL